MAQQPKSDGLGGKPKNRGKDSLASAPERPKYVMPAVGLGDVVLWGPDIEGEPDTAAIVTRVFNESVDLLILHPGYHNGNPMDGVRHADHTDRQALKAAASGHWRHTPQRIALEARVEAMEQFLADLNAPPAHLAGAHAPPQQGA